jgi:hypothetical protein
MDDEDPHVVRSKVIRVTRDMAGVEEEFVYEAAL